jgi:magnesium transporter
VQRLLHKTARGDPLIEAESSRLSELLDGSVFVWIDLRDEPIESILEIATILHLDEQSVIETAETRLLPRIDDDGRYVSVVLNALADMADRMLSFDELDLYIGKRFLLTVRESEFPSLRLLQSPVNAAMTASVDSPARLAALIAQIGTRRFLSLITTLDGRIDELENMAMTSDPRTLPEVHALRRDVGVLRRVAGPQRDIFSDLAESLHPAVDETAARAFDRVFDHYLKIVDSLDAARNLLSSVLETHRGAVADETNEIVRLLTVFSAILLPLSVIAGIWGMNFVSIPLSRRPWGFWLLVGSMAFFAVALWVYFVRRNFIGGIKLRELPKSVGLGLIHIGSAPLKAVGTGFEATRRTVGRSAPVQEMVEEDRDIDP